MTERHLMSIILEVVHDGDLKLTLHGSAEFAAMDKMLSKYGYTVIAVGGVVGVNTVAVIRKVER